MTRKPASASCPQVVLDWIAWYPEGNLPADVRSAIELHAAECVACRQELAVLTGEGSVDVSAAAGAERAFARTRDKISAQPRELKPPRRRSFWVVQPRLAVAAAATVAVISGTVGVVATQLRSEAVYETASSDTLAPHSAAAPHLDVIFRANASFAEVARAMQAIGASVESGPSPSGVVHLRLGEGADAAAVAQRLESGDLQIAEFAQPAP